MYLPLGPLAMSCAVSLFDFLEGRNTRLDILLSPVSTAGKGLIMYKYKNDEIKLNSERVWLGMGLKSRVSEAEKKSNVGLRDYNYGQSGAFLRSLEMKI